MLVISGLSYGHFNGIRVLNNKLFMEAQQDIGRSTECVGPRAKLLLRLYRRLYNTSKYREWFIRKLL